MSNKVEILFFARLKNKNKKNLAPIYARIIANSQRVEFSTGLSIDPKHWNGNTAKVVAGNANAQLINTYISTKKIEFKRIYNDLLLEQKEITAEIMKNRLLGIQEIEASRTFLELMDFHISIFKSKIGTDTAISTYRKYMVTKKRLEEFIPYQYKKKDINLSDLKLEFIASFDLYLKAVCKNNHNTVVKHCKNVKAIINHGIQYEWLETNPFTKYKTPYKEGDKGILTKEELATLMAKEFKIPRLAVVRDLFVFQCYTGLAYTDMKELTQADIQIGIDGNRWIIKRRTKTNQRSPIPLLPQAIDILEKYNWQGKQDNAPILPVMTNQKMNAYLVEIVELCGISKKITTHVGRRTFATTITLSNGVPIESVSAMLGHTNLKTTQIYAKVVDTKISQDMQQLKEKLSGGNLKKVVNGDS
ncbi:Site-specific recombinase XerD [Chitinophaga terrae (ex Kim and Jung 2007)]|uniref:Site-specific recombinase XerD n=1 Tax=Chitinophaga terrae (ex Kim and Jung 2007) TaxID=408074 RepID=A0A1H4FTW0_9BACT|nr:site-specific integrase [Chitinophaga terrae (ex Kim and Jung 2007)]GEP92877.1 transposase [Chitinophaga terrae (ex Kim and Jung 2007)]SEB00756.1 Site-specific recombinase XerD [Chitinophaga terrae (ex Kim and Jung 2007)]